MEAMKQTKSVAMTPIQKPLSSVKKKKTPKRRKKEWGWWMTLLLAVVLLGLVASLWALFISGPAKVQEEKVAQVKARIEEQVPSVEGLMEHAFDFVTWQGYTADTLYWFDATGQIITQREMGTLNYDGARQKALSEYGMEANTIELAYGYSGPVYQLTSDKMLLMLDYDTLDWVYERNVTNGR